MAISSREIEKKMVFLKNKFFNYYLLTLVTLFVSCSSFQKDQHDFSRYPTSEKKLDHTDCIAILELFTTGKLTLRVLTDPLTRKKMIKNMVSLDEDMKNQIVNLINLRGFSTNLSQQSLDLLNNLYRDKKLNFYEINDLLKRINLEGRIEIYFTDKFVMKLYPKEQLLETEAKLMLKMVHSLSENNKISAEQGLFFERIFYLSDLKREEFYLVAPKIMDIIPSEPSYVLYRQAIQYSRSIKDVAKREDFLSNINHLYDLTYLSKNSDAQIFMTNHFSTVRTYQEKVLAKNGRLRDSFTEVDWENHLKLLREVHEYEKLYYGCRALSNNNGNLRASGKKVVWAMTTAGLVSTTGMYFWVKGEEEKDAKWWGRLMWYLTTNTLLNLINGKLFWSNLSNVTLKNAFLTYAVEDIALSAGYSFFFDDTDAQVKDKLEKALKDPEFRKAYERYVDNIIKADLINKTKSEYLKMFKTANAEMINPEALTKDFVEDNINYELTEEKSIEVYAQFIAEKNKAPLAFSSNKGVNNYTYNRAFDSVSLIKTVVLTKFLTNYICMAQSPKQAFWNSTAIYLSSNIIFSGLYIYGRDELIGD
jgi:hypothetical protein